MGERAPNASVQTLNGDAVDLSTLWSGADRGLALVFLRHYGCPFCKEHAREIDSRSAELRVSGVHVAFIGCGTSDEARTFRDELRLTNPVFDDADRTAYEAYGIGVASLGAVLNPRVMAGGVRAAAKGFLPRRVEWPSPATSGSVPDRARWDHPVGVAASRHERHPTSQRLARRRHVAALVVNRHDQRDLWITAYGSSPGPSPHSSTFAGECLQRLPPNSRLLELGCGTGADAEAFAKAGHTVIATDFVPAVVEANRKRQCHIPVLNLTFDTMRIDEPYPFAPASFDAVYAHLTLHYFLNDITIKILAEIHRVLASGGLLLFACKSPADPAYGKGVEIERDMFDFHGKIRHFFNEEYARELLAETFKDVEIQSHRGKLHRQRAGWITVVARSL